jgi:hypothetical protein
LTVRLVSFGSRTVPPLRFLEAADVVRVSLEGVGVLENPVVRKAT